MDSCAARRSRRPPLTAAVRQFPISRQRLPRLSTGPPPLTAFRPAKVRVRSSRSVTESPALGTRRGKSGDSKSARNSARWRSEPCVVPLIHNWNVKSLSRFLGQERDTANRHLYLAHMQLALQAWKIANTARLKELLDAHRPQTGQPDLRRWEWYYLLARPRGGYLAWAHRLGAFRRVARNARPTSTLEGPWCSEVLARLSCECRDSGSRNMALDC